MLLTTQDLLTQGLTTQGIRALCSEGRYRRLRRGIYEAVEPDVKPPTPQAEHRRLIEAVLHDHPDAVLSHFSAAVILGLPVPQSSLAMVHLLRPARRTGTKRSGNLCVHRVIEEVQSASVGPLRVTPLGRTTLDLVRVLSPMYATAVADRALALGADREALLDRVAHQPRRRGNTRARRVLAFADPRAESPGESWARWAMAEAALPIPDLQAEFRDPITHRFVARTDFYWRAHRLVGEFDGRIKYGRCLKPGQQVEDVMLAEKDREEALRTLGLWVVRLRTKDLFQQGAVERIVRNGFAYARP